MAEEVRLFAQSVMRRMDLSGAKTALAGSYFARNVL
jgi:hypothetical protein